MENQKSNMNSDSYKQKKASKEASNLSNEKENKTQISNKNNNNNNNLEEIIDLVNEKISSQVSLKNEHNQNQMDINDYDPMPPEDEKAEKIENPFLTNDEGFMKQMREWHRMMWIQNGNAPEEFDRNNAPSKKQINTLDSFLNLNKNKSNNNNINNKNKLIKNGFADGNEEFQNNRSVKFNEMNFNNNKNKSSFSYNNNANPFNNKLANKNVNELIENDDIDEGDRRTNFYRNKKPNNANGGYMNNNFAYKRKQKNEYDEEAYDEENNNNKRYGKYNNNNKKYGNKGNYFNKNRRKFNNYEDEDENDQEENNANRNENVGFMSALDKYNTKNKIQKVKNDLIDDDENNNINNIQSKNSVRKNVNNINININANSIYNNITNEKKQENDMENANIVNLVSKAALGNKYKPPYKKGESYSNLNKSNINNNNLTSTKEEVSEKESELDKKLKGYDKKMIEVIESEILTSCPDVKWDDIAGLEFAKKTIKEIIIWPMLRPDIFNGIRRPPKGLLLFGPPGTGKTMIAKAIASESKSKFFNISASSLMSKWVGESEKLVRTLFALASFYQPSVVFIDEIDSLLTSRNENECESSRRLKTEFLVQLDGAGTNQDDRILIIGATNRPQEIDEAFLRRMSKRLYIPLPNKKSRKQLIETVIKKESEKNNKYDIQDEQMDEILRISKGYSGSDLMGVCREAAMMPIRSIEDILAVSLDTIRDVNLGDFQDAVKLIRPSVSEKTIGFYVEWNKNFGSFQFEDKDQ